MASVHESMYPPKQARTKVQIPLQTYRFLEEKNQKLRLAVLRRAACTALENREPSETGRARVSQNDVNAALEHVTKLDKLNGHHSESHVKAEVPRETYLWLDRHLDSLKMLVIKMAATLISDEQSDAEPTDQITLTPQIMERAWDRIWSNTSLVSATLTKS